MSLSARLVISFLVGGNVSRQFRLFLWFMLGMLLGGFAATAKADYPAVGKWSYPWSGSTGGFASVAAVCAYDISLSSWSASWPGYTFTCVNINQPSPVSPGQTGSYQVKAEKPPYSPSYTNRTTTYYLACPDGGTLSGSICVIACTAGQASSGTRHTGCYDNDGIDNGCDSGTYLPTPAQLCNGSCWFTVSSATNCSAPTGGGPITCTYTGTTTGGSCSPSDIPAQPAPTDKCPTGYAIGSVNGVSGCYKTGSQPPETTTTTSSTSGDTTTTVKTTTNTTTNTTTTTTTTTNNVTGTTTTTTQITPTDPAKPILDPSLKAPGEEQKPWEIDESGTPTDGSLSAQKADYEAKATERKNYIESLGNQGNHGLTWDWTFELPGGTCTAYTFTIASKTFTLDPCEKFGMIRDALGFLIYITTALALLAIATGYGKEGK